MISYNKISMTTANVTGSKWFSPAIVAGAPGMTPGNYNSSFLPSAELGDPGMEPTSFLANLAQTFGGLFGSPDSATQPTQDPDGGATAQVDKVLGGSDLEGHGQAVMAAAQGANADPVAVGKMAAATPAPAGNDAQGPSAKIGAAAKALAGSAPQGVTTRAPSAETTGDSAAPAPAKGLSPNETARTTDSGETTGDDGKGPSASTAPSAAKSPSASSPGAPNSAGGPGENDGSGGKQGGSTVG